MNLLLGTNATNNYASIQASLSGTGPEPLALNPAGGNVGIGTTYPQTTLQLYNSSNPKIYLNGPPYNGFVSLTTGSAALDFGFDTTSISGSTTGGIIRFMPNGSEVMRITNGGSVGIGTNSPSYTLDIVGSARATTGLNVGNGTGAVALNLYDLATASWQITTGGYNLSINNNSGSWTNRVTINQSGQVGIGTNSPAQTLDVYGAIARSGLKLPRVDYGVIAAGSSITIPILFSDTQYNMVEIRVKYLLSNSNVNINLSATSTQPAALNFSEVGLTSIPYNNPSAPTYTSTPGPTTSILFANNAESFYIEGNLLFRMIRTSSTTSYYRNHYSYDNVYCWSGVGTARGSGMGHIDLTSSTYQIASITLTTATTSGGASTPGTISCTWSTTHYN